MWCVCKIKTDRTATLEKDSASATYPVKPVIAHEFGEHASRDEAVKALVLMFYPENFDSSIEHIKRISKEFLSGSMKTYKILKV